MVVPDFGGFVLVKHSAQWSDSNSRLMPPGKHLSFNVQLRQNDGLLSSYIQTKLKLEFDVANKHLAEFAAYCHSVLQAKRRLSLSGIGFFYLDFENNICFEPQRELNFLPESFGLTAISLHALEAPKVSEPVQTKPVFEDRVLSQRELVSHPGKKIYRSVYSLATLALLALIIGLLVSERQMSGNIQAALGIPTTASSYVPGNYPSLDIVLADQNTTRLVTDANGVARLDFFNSRSIPVLADAQKFEDIILAERRGFEIVFGCFAKSGNAQKLVKRLKSRGLKASISQTLHKNMQVVCAGTYANRQLAETALEAVRASQPNAWIRIKQ